MTAPSIDEIITGVLRDEGGYVDDPADPGGATNHGISLRYAVGVGIDNDGDGDTDADDIRLVTPQQARTLYLADFWQRPGINRLPPEIQPVTVDWAVNAGPPRAIMGVQRVITLAGIARLVEDGVIGPKTRSAAFAAQRDMGPLFNNAIVDERMNFYRRLAMQNTDMNRFLKGWLDRTARFRLEIH